MIRWICAAVRAGCSDRNATANSNEIDFWINAVETIVVDEGANFSVILSRS